MNREEVWGMPEMQKWFKCATYSDFCNKVKNAIPADIDSAWEKTFVKWFLIAAGYHSESLSHSNGETCGLCNLFWDDSACSECPIKKDAKALRCEKTPFIPYLFAAAKGRDDPDFPYLILQEIIYLCTVAREFYGESEHAEAQ